MTRPGAPGPPDHPVFQARRAIAGLILIGIAVLAAAVLAGRGGPGRRGGDAVHATLPAPTLATTPPQTRRLAQARAVERVRRRLPYVAVAGRQHREIALTFDDGPGPYTLRVLRALQAQHAPATFFQVGSQARTFTDAERAQIADPAAVIGNHTWSHRRLSTLSAHDQADELDGMSAQLQASSGRPPQLFRPPFGAFDRTTERLLAGRHLLTVLWTVDSQDYERPGTRQIIRTVLAGARPGAIILLHDAGGDRSQTVAALPAIIRRLRAKHYALVTVPRLLLDNPPPGQQPPVSVGVG